MVGPFATSPGLGIKSVKGCQTFLGRSHGTGGGKEVGPLSSLGNACGAAVGIRQAVELSWPWRGHP